MKSGRSWNPFDTFRPFTQIPIIREERQRMPFDTLRPFTQIPIIREERQRMPFDRMKGGTGYGEFQKMDGAVQRGVFADGGSFEGYCCR